MHRSLACALISWSQNYPRHPRSLIPRAPVLDNHADFAHLVTLPPDSEEQQAAVVEVQDEDGFNWG